MPWKTEIDRLVHHLVVEAASGGPADVRRATRAIADLAELAPGRASTQFHAGALEEILTERAEDEAVQAQLEELPAAEDDGARRWRHLGRLDGASRGGRKERVHELMEDPLFEASLDHPEGRVALRSVGRQLLREGEGDRAFELYRRHLAGVPEEGSRRDAEFLLEESLRRADRGDAPEEDTLDRLSRAAAFALEAGLDARAQSKVDRKLGRIHQLAGRGGDATECYRRALERLPEEDPYRSVLVGDLALATLGVRGTLDLLPCPEREHRAEAEEILRSGQGGEGRSYNAIYTLGMLAYERGDWSAAADAFAEADRLMRENRAKARIVHARSRFFLGHCRLELGAQGEELEEAERAIVKNASAVSLDPELKGPVFDVLAEVSPGARIPGRATGRGPRSDAGRPTAAQHLAAAREALQTDPHRALEHVDRAFKSRPDFETWYGAYRTRLEALVALGEREEALRTYERFRAKLYDRDALEPLEDLLREGAGLATDLFDPADHHAELADLYDALPDAGERFCAECMASAEANLASGDPVRILRALGLFREAASRGVEGAEAKVSEAMEAARAAGSLEEPMPRKEIEDLLGAEEDPVRLVVVGGDKGRSHLVERFNGLASELGFEGEWIFTGVRPPYKTLREVAAATQDADVVLMHHALGPDMCREIRALGEKYDVPVREAGWLGTANLEAEVLASLKEAFVD